MPGTAPAPENVKAKRLTLIGYRACGKTTVGRMVAERKQWPYVDADKALERRLGEPVATWFPAHGEAAFRDQEAACLTEVLAGDGPMVLSTGGGAILRPENRRLLRSRGGLVVFMDAPVAVLQGRLRKDHGDRPSLTGLPIADEVERLLQQRMPFYLETAHKRVDSSMGIEAVVGTMMGLLDAELFYHTSLRQNLLDEP